MDRLRELLYRAWVTLRIFGAWLVSLFRGEK